MRKPAILTAILALILLALWFVCRPKPPNLAGCTRVEIQYEQGALYHLFPGPELEQSLLSQQERDHIRSYDRWTLTDRESMRAFARSVAEGAYWGKVPGPPAMPGVYVTGYREADPATAFIIYGVMVLTEEEKKAFEYSLKLTDLPAIEPPGLKTLKARWDCASTLSRLHTVGLWRWKAGGLLNPDRNHWCDTAVRTFRSYHHSYADRSGRRGRLYSDAAIAKAFTCPSTQLSADANEASPRPTDANLPNQNPRGRACDYAMNPNCEPNSPEDVVLLFEAQRGWNQYGGPELFNLDNHDPKGGCVLLNDGTLKFIRTKEELAQLRWKP